MSISSNRLAYVFGFRGPSASGLQLLDRGRGLGKIEKLEGGDRCERYHRILK